VYWLHYRWCIEVSLSPSVGFFLLSWFSCFLSKTHVTCWCWSRATRQNYRLRCVLRIFVDTSDFDLQVSPEEKFGWKSVRWRDQIENLSSRRLRLSRAIHTFVSLTEWYLLVFFSRGFSWWLGTTIHRSATWTLIDCCIPFSQYRFIRVNSSVCFRLWEKRSHYVKMLRYYCWGKKENFQVNSLPRRLGAVSTSAKRSSNSGPDFGVS